MSMNSSARGSPAAAGATPWRLRFEVGVAKQGAGTLRQITYFPVQVSAAPPDPTADAPILWAGAPSYVYRRYSEFVKLRRYLVLKYPGELFPALPAKSMGETFNTAMCDGATLTQQGHMLSFFLALLSEKPRVYKFDSHICAFLQLPRDSSDIPSDRPETRVAVGVRSYANFAATLGVIDQEITRMERELDHTDPNVFASSATTAMSGFVRSTALAISSLTSLWSSQQSSAAPKDAQQVTQSAILNKCNEDQGFRDWERVRGIVTNELARITQLHENAAAVQAEQTEEFAAEQGVGQALQGLADVLTEGADAALRKVVTEVCEIAPTRAAIAQQNAKASRELARMLFNEALCIQGIVEAISLHLNRYRYLASLTLNQVNPLSKAQREQETIKLTNMNGALNQNIKLWIQGLRVRVNDIGRNRGTKMSAALAAAIDILDQSAAVRFMASPEYLKVADDERTP